MGQRGNNTKALVLANNNKFNDRESSLFGIAGQ